jgi:hypothetical protein
MRYLSYLIAFTFFGIGSATYLHSAADTSETFHFVSRRQTGDLDHVNVLLEATGDVLTKSDSGAKPGRVKFGLECRREYDEKTLQLPSVKDTALRGVRFYQEASANFKKGDVAHKPVLRPENRTVGVEIAGEKATLFSLKGPFNVDELELATAVGESLCLDQVLPSKPVKCGDSWKIPDETIAVLLGLEDVTSSTVQVVLGPVTADSARLELAGEVKGGLFGAANEISLKGRCRFDRRTGRIDWFAVRLKQSRECGIVEDGLDATVLVQIKINRITSCEQLSDAVLAGLSVKPSEELTGVQYRHSAGGWQVTHDRSWFLIDRSRDFDEFHRLDRGQDLGLCKASPQPQVGAAKLPTLEQFQGIAQKLLGDHFGEFLEVSQAQSPAQLRILRVKARGKDNEVPVRWFFYLVSDPEGRQVSLVFRVEEKWLAAFGKADEQFVHSLRFVEKKEK